MDGFNSTHRNRRQQQNKKRKAMQQQQQQQSKKRNTDNTLKEEGDQGENLDFISGLPDEVLIHLLSFLDMKVAGRTSILSKRWRSVWTHMMDLAFVKMDVKAEMNQLSKCIDHVIASNQAPYLETFRVHYMGVDSHSANIDKWINFAFHKKVRNLGLFFLSSCTHFGSPAIHFSNIHTSLGNTALECLHLQYVSIDAALLEWVVSHCPNLQRLSLCGCKPISFFTPRKLVISCPKLKHLELSYCLKSLKFESVRISTPQLNSIMLFERDPIQSVMFPYVNMASLDNRGLNVNFCSIPLLTDASFGWLFCRHLLIQNLDITSTFASRLERLAITWDEALLRIGAIPTFANVKVLEIAFQPSSLYNEGGDLLKLTKFFEACPALRVFTLKLYTVFLLGQSSEVSDDQVHAICAHQHLKTVEFVGYDGSQTSTKFATCLIWNAPVLKKFIFDTRNPLSTGSSCDLNEDERKAYARRQAEIVTIRESLDVVIL